MYFSTKSLLEILCTSKRGAVHRTKSFSSSTLAKEQPPSVVRDVGAFARIAVSPGRAELYEQRRSARVPRLLSCWCVLLWFFCRLASPPRLLQVQCA